MAAAFPNLTMYRALRVLPLALGPLAAFTAILAQPAELPPIFAPRVEARRSPAAPHPVATSGLSDRMRAAITERVLVGAKAFEPPVSAEAAPESPTPTADGALLMRRFVVRSVAPRREEVEPAAVPTWEFGPVDRIDRRVNGYSATLFQLSGGLFFNLNVVNGAGRGIDHGRDFTRVEFEFSLKPALNGLFPTRAGRAGSRKSP